MRGSAVSVSLRASTITAPARVAASLAFSLGSEKKVLCCAVACSSEPTCATSVSALPATRPPRRDAICPSVSGPGIALFRRRLAFERLDHLVGDVDARAAVHGVLQDQVELLLLGDLVDHPVGLLDHLRQLLVAALVQVLPELALLALEVAVQLAELALAVAALALAHGHRVLLDVVLHLLQVARDARQLLVALLELAFDLALRAHRRHRLAQDALGVDVADLHRRRDGLRDGERRRRQERGHQESRMPTIQASERSAEGEL